MASLSAVVSHAADQTADPERALANFNAWVDAFQSPSPYLRSIEEHPDAIKPLMAIFAASQSLSNVLRTEPELAGILLEPGFDRRPNYQEEADRAWQGAPTLEAALDRLRWMKRRDFLAIAALDCLDRIELTETVERLSDLADAVVQAALDIAHNFVAPSQVCIIAFGKLGGRELNYSSDIDLVMLTKDEPAPNDLKVAEALIRALSGQMRRGILYRTDMRLRPEGRFGRLVRSLGATRSYYEHWAEPWERQALIKARRCAGNAETGRDFERFARAFAYRAGLQEKELEAIRAMKRRAESETEKAGETETNIKLGRGGIRDIEFVAQLLQLAHGGRNPRLQTRSTLAALARLAEAGFLEADEAKSLADAYRFLRHVEHRLQLLEEHQTHLLPNDERKRIAKLMGAPETFEKRLDACRHSAREALERHFYGGQSLQSRPDSLDWAVFKDQNEAEQALKSMGSETSYGVPFPEAAETFAQIKSELVAACARSVDPDLALKNLASLAASVPNPGQLFAMFRDSPQTLSRLAELSAIPRLWSMLMRRPELIDSLFDEQTADTEARTGFAIKPGAWSRIAFRERLRAGARFVWGIIDRRQLALELTSFADAVLLTAKTEAGLDNESAIAAMGRLGARRPGLGSDWDVVLIGNNGAAAEKFLQLCNEAVEKGEIPPIDSRLRPEGRSGALIRSIDYYEEYYSRHAEPWERLAAVNLRIIGDDPHGYGQRLQNALMSRPVSPESRTEMNRLRLRMKSERKQKGLDLKFADGGMADIELTMQLAVLERSAENHRLRAIYDQLAEARDWQWLTEGALPATANPMREAMTEASAIVERVWTRGGCK